MLVPLPDGLANEKGDAVDPAPPNRPPVAGAVVVVGWPEAPLDAGVPNEKDISAVVVTSVD